MACKIGAIVYGIVQFIAFLFILVGTAIDQFRRNGKLLGNTPCYTLWGLKDKCYSTKVDKKIDDVFRSCTKRQQRFKAAEAMAIISILVFAVACVLGFIRLCCCNCFRWVCLILSIVGAVTSLIVWAIMVHVYSNRDDCTTSMRREGYKYGAGFALYVTGWCLSIIAIIVLFIPC